MSFLDRFRMRERTAGAPSGDAEVARAPRADWRSLPMIHMVQRSTAPVTVDAAFGRRLTTSHAPSFLDDLGHIVSASAPGGLISGLAVPGTTVATDAPPARAGEASRDAPELSVTRRVEFGPSTRGTTVGTMVTPAPPTSTLSQAPMPPVQRVIESASPVTMPQRPLDAPSGETGASLPTPARRAADTEQRMVGSAPTDPPSPAVVQPIQRTVASDTPDAVHHRASEPTSGHGADAGQGAGRAAPASSPREDRATDVVPILSRSLSPLPTHPRIGRPLDPGEDALGSANRSAPAPVPESVRPATTFAPTRETAVDELGDATRPSDGVARLATVAEPSASSTSDAPPDDEPIAPLSGAVALSRLTPADTPGRPDTPLHSEADTEPDGTPPRTWTQPTDARFPSSASGRAPTDHHDSAAMTGQVQRQVTEPYASAFETAVPAIDAGTAVVRPTVGRHSSPIAQRRSSARHDAPGATPVAARSLVDTASANTAVLQRAVTAVPDGGRIAVESNSGSPAAAMIPPSIAYAAAWASEVTPLGRAALETFSFDSVGTSPLPARELSRTVSSGTRSPVARSPVAGSPVARSPGSWSAVSPGAASFLQRNAETGSDAGRHDREGDTASALSMHAQAEWLPVQTARDGSSPAGAVASPAGGRDERPAGSPFSDASEADVIGLLRTMYPHLRRRLSRDLLLERDRSGHRTDIRF